MRKFVIASIFLLSSTLSSFAENPAMRLPMTIDALPNNIVRFQGIIDSKADERFEDFVKSHDTTNMTIVFNSYGGIVENALTIGRRIRELKMNTTVGIANVDGTISRGGTCDSACPFMFLGGVKRTLTRGNSLRVHQIYIPMNKRAVAHQKDVYGMSELGQVERSLADMSYYIQEMGGSESLMVIAAQTPPYEVIHELTNEEIEKTKMVTN